MYWAFTGGTHSAQSVLKIISIHPSYSLNELEAIIIPIYKTWTPRLRVVEQLTPALYSW